MINVGFSFDRSFLAKKLSRDSQLFQPSVEDALLPALAVLALLLLIDCDLRNAKISTVSKVFSTKWVDISSQNVRLTLLRVLLDATGRDYQQGLPEL